jgi:TolB-like protein
VGAVLEGSVRRSGNTVRVTTQLINAVAFLGLRLDKAAKEVRREP